MNLFSRLFGSGKKTPDLPPDVVKVFEKIEHFLTDDEAQNAALPEQVRRVLEAGPAVDELPGASGEFGRTATNPIPVNGPVGELAYLSRLITSSGSGIFGHRLGHIDKVDVYETVSTDGDVWDVLFLSFYHPRKSRKAPVGYRLAGARERPAFITCTNFRVESFPHQMEAAIRECMRQVMGFPVRPPNVAELLRSGRFVRTPVQNVRLAKLAELRIEQAADYRGAGG